MGEIMLVRYAYCETCGMEWIDEIVLTIQGNYANGTFLVCRECNGSIGPGNYDLVNEQGQGEDENITEKDE
ncbi:unnamed protein product [marine sediment metagenome]|uniref:Uncharacterized protein n=1 Tax=marine sediment metagenome TaxID=412755 RepID=X0VQT1_9ZZZZ